MRTTLLRSLATAATAISLISVPTIVSAANPASGVSIATASISATDAKEMGLKFHAIVSPIIKVGATYTIRPAGVDSNSFFYQVQKTRVTVSKKGKRIGARNATSVKVPAGIYQITTTAYLAGGGGTFSSTQTLNVRSAVNVKSPKIKGLKVAPQVSVTKGSKLTSQKISVTQAGKIIRKNASSATLRKGTYKVKTTAKYSYTYKSKTLVNPTNKPIKNAPCKVVKVGPVFMTPGIHSLPAGEARNITAECTGNFDGKVKINYLINLGSKYNYKHGALSDARTVLSPYEGWVYQTEHPLIQGGFKVGTKFKDLIWTDKPLFKTAIVKGLGVTSKTHTVRLK